MRALLNALEEAVARQALYRSNMKERYNESTRTAKELENTKSEALLLVDSLIVKGSPVKQALVNRLAYLYKVRALTSKNKHKSKRSENVNLQALTKMLTSINADIVELEQLLIGVN